MPVKTTCDLCEGSLNSAPVRQGVRIDIPPDEVTMPCGCQFHVGCFVNDFDANSQALVEIPNSTPLTVYDVNSIEQNGELVVDGTRGTRYRRKALAVDCPDCNEQGLTVEWTDAKRAQLTQFLGNVLACLPGEVYLQPDDQRQPFFPEAQLPHQQRILAHNGLLIWLPNGVNPGDLREDNGRLVHLPTKLSNSQRRNQNEAIQRDLQALTDALDAISDQAESLDEGRVTDPDRIHTFMRNLAVGALTVMAKYWAEEPTTNTLDIPGRAGRTVRTELVLRVRMILQQLRDGRTSLAWDRVAQAMETFKRAL